METKEQKVDRQKADVIKYLTHFPFYKWAAKAAGISVSTLERMRKDDSVFDEGCELARSAAVGAWGAYASPEFMLKATDPETFAQPDKLELSGDVKIDIDGILGLKQMGDTSDKTTDGDTNASKSPV
jgi:hypothetical protein